MSVSINNFHVGQIVDDMTIERVYRDETGQPKVDVLCNVCGNRKSVFLYRVKKGTFFHSAACDKMPISQRCPVGTIIGDMTVIDHVQREYGRRVDIKLKCNVCGKEKISQYGNILKGEGVTSHAYCDRGEYNNYNGLSTQHRRLYNIWKLMISRIYNTKDENYYRYGGAGLTTDYNDFMDFLNELGPSYYEHIIRYGEADTTIDRINNNLGYVRGNIRWATKKEQSQNRKCMENNYFLAKSPEGQLYLSNNQSRFASDHHINRGNMSGLLNQCDSSQAKTVGGWTFSKMNNPAFFPMGDYIIDETVNLNGEPMMETIRNYALGGMHTGAAPMPVQTTPVNSGKRIPIEERFPVGMIVEDMTIAGYHLTPTSNNSNRKDLLVKCNVCGSTKTIQVGNLMNNKHCCSHKTCSYVKRI